MVSIRNLERFFDDHADEYGDMQDVLLAAAREHADDRGALMSGFVTELLGGEAQAEEFWKEVTSNLTHMRMGVEDLGPQSAQQATD